MIRHKEYLVDRAAMLVLRGVLVALPPIRLEPDARAQIDNLLGRIPQAEGMRFEPGTAGGVVGWWCLPEGAPSHRAVLYLHGGAYVVGSAAAYRPFVSQLAVRTHTAIFIASYRLAPESTFPVAVEDAVAAYRGLYALGFEHIALAGDSAGGGLALVLLAHATRTAASSGLPAPTAAAAFSPWTDLSLAGASLEGRANGDLILRPTALRQAARQYLGTADPLDPDASPLHGNLSGLPPVLLHVGEDDVLLDDSQGYATRMQEVGGSAELHVWQGMPHVFQMHFAVMRAAAEALDHAARFLRTHLGDVG